MSFSNIFRFSKNRWQEDIVPFPTDLKAIQKIEITHYQSQKQAVLDRNQIQDFLSFMKKGACNKSLKGATRYQINIQHEEGSCDYFINGESLAPEKGGLVQSSFTPRKRGFEVFLHSFF